MIRESFLKSSDYIKRHAVSISLIFAGAVLMTDIFTPLGSAEWILYLLPIYFISYSRKIRNIYIIAAVCTVMVVIGLLLSPQGKEQDYPGPSGGPSASKAVKRHAADLRILQKDKDDKGYWEEVSSYITRHSEVLFSHGICPACAEKVLEEVDKSNGETGSEATDKDSLS